MYVLDRDGVEWLVLETAPLLKRALRRLRFGDALLFQCGWRLELVAPDAGLPCFYFYERDLRLVGIVQIHSWAFMEGIQGRLFGYLVGRGALGALARFMEYGALTPPDQTPHYLPHLFRYRPRRYVLPTRWQLGAAWYVYARPLLRPPRRPKEEARVVGFRAALEIWRAEQRARRRETRKLLRQKRAQ